MPDNKKTIEAILIRLAELTEASNDAQLADHLGVTRQVISKWKKRGTIPYEKIIDFAHREDISVDWLLFGDSENLEDLPETIVLRNFGALIGMTFKKQGAAIVSMTTPEICRIIEGCISHFEKSSPLNSELLHHLNEVKKYLYEDETSMCMVAEVVIAQLGAKLTPMFPEDHLMKLFPYDDPLMKQIRDKTNSPK